MMALWYEEMPGHDPHGGEHQRVFYATPFDLLYYHGFALNDPLVDSWTCGTGVILLVAFVAKNQ